VKCQHLINRPATTIGSHVTSIWSLSVYYAYFLFVDWKWWTLNLNVIISDFAPNTIPIWYYSYTKNPNSHKLNIQSILLHTMPSKSTTKWQSRVLHEHRGCNLLKIGNLANERPSTTVNQLLYKLSQFSFPVGRSSKVTTFFILYR